MSKLTFKGEIVHGEKYEKDGETKWNNTKLGTLWHDEAENEYVVKYLGQWCKVFPPKQRDLTEAKQAAQSADKTHAPDLEDEIPF